jgi:PAS domain S-box-containing protein
MELNLFNLQPATEEILESITDGFLFYDNEGIIHYWNHRAEEYLGIPRAEALGRNIWSVFPEEVGHLFYQRYSLALERQQPDEFEGYLGRLDRWFVVLAYPSPQGLAIFFRDVTERHDRERELQDIRTLFDLVLRATNEAVCDVDLLQGTVSWYGPNYQKLFGHEVAPDGTSSATWLDGVHPDDLPGVLKQYQEAIEGGSEVFTAHYRFRRADGFYAMVRCRTLILRNDAGTAVRAVAAMEDITPLEEAARRHEQREREFRLMFDNAPLPQWLFDPRTLHLLAVNTAALEQYGYSREAFLELTLDDLRPPEDRAFFHYQLNNNSLPHAEWKNVRHQRRDGSILHVQLRTTPVTYQGRPATLVTVNDITAVHDARESVQRTQEDYKRLFRSAPLPHCICTADASRIIAVNDAAVDLYGFSREELLAMTPFDLSLPEDHAALAEGIRLLQRTGTLKSITRHRVKSGATIIVELNAVLVDLDQERRLLVTLNDITYERQLEANISALKVSAQKMLTRAQLNAQEEERAEIGRELHDNINQQLTSVKLYVEMARSREALCPELLEKCEGILQDAINGIRSLSKNLVQPVFGAEGLSAAIGELCATFEDTAKFSVTCDLRVAVSDQELALTIYRVVQEALTNASKYAGASNVWVFLEESGNALVLTVRDDGRGFDPTKRSHGIGLTNIARRVDLFNGKLGIDSTPGGGCTLTATLPLPGMESGALFIAIADDDEDDRELLEAAFHELAPHCRLHFAVDGMDLLEYLRASTDIPDLIVIDQNMPLLNGVDTLQALSLEPRFRRVPKVLYSTSIRPEDRRGAYATAYIEKSVETLGTKNSVQQMMMLVRGER